METTRQPVAATTPGLTDGDGLSAGRGLSPALRSLLVAAGVIVLLVVLVAGARFLAYATTHETTDDAMIDADEVQLTSKIAERVDRILVDTNQRVHKGQLLIQLQDTDEQTRVAQARAVADAQRAQARAAEETVALTRDTQQAQNAQAAGAIAQAEAGITGADALAKSSQQEIDVAKAAVAAAQAEYKAAQAALPGALENERKADADFRRAASLVATGDFSQAQLDAARAEYESARSSYAQAQANVVASQANVDEAQQKLDSQIYATSSTQAQIGAQQALLTSARGKLQESDAPSRVPAQQAQAQAAAAQVTSLDAQLRSALDQLSYTKIVSPIEGYVGQKNVEVGQTVAPGESLLTLIPVSPIYITANYKETQIGHMKVGQEVDIHVDAYGGTNFVGHVETLSPAAQNKFSLVPAQNATGNFVKVTQRVPIRIVFDNPDPNYPLRPGMNVETSVKVK
ncbi:MAG: HlyD family secretion protein [Candidatus Baltobacteraceae bacterium]|jgi:membrane fusion protein (multidrug efflux system)